jgi:serine/threonine protein kinase
MTSRGACPDRQAWQSLLEGRLGPDQEGPLTSHLDQCTECRVALASIAAGDRISEAALRQLGQEPAAVGPAMREVLDSWTGAPAASAPRPSPGAPEALPPFLEPPDADDCIGRWGSYRVLKLLGRGGMGEVYLARDPVLGRLVAIKSLTAHLRGDPGAHERFLREARAAAALNHPNIVTIYAAEEAGPLLLLVMEYVDGISLRERIRRRGRLALAEIVRIGFQVATGLAAAHAAGLVHRDIKPGNILLARPANLAKIADFGLALAVDDPGVASSGDVVGTPAYMAPEQAQGKAVDHRADLFSLGSVLYAMCTGQSPYQGDAMSVLRQMAEGSLPSIPSTGATAPAWLVELVSRLHATQPADRIQSAAEVAQLLRRQWEALRQPAGSALTGVARAAEPTPVAGNVVAPPVTPPPPPPPLPPPRQVAPPPVAEPLAPRGGPRRSNRRWVAAGSGILLATLLALVWARWVHWPGGTPSPGGLDDAQHDSLPAVAATTAGTGPALPANRQQSPLPAADVSAADESRPSGGSGRPAPDHVASTTLLLPRGTVHPVNALVDKGPIVLLGRDGIERRKFATLDAALEQALSGDTVEIRSDALQQLSPVNLRDKALSIRAAAGFGPKIGPSPAGLSADAVLIRTEAALTLEGLDIECRPSVPGGLSPGGIVSARGADLRMANCRVIHQGEGPILALEDASRCDLRNSLLYSKQAAAVDCLVRKRILVHAENCILAGFSGIALRKPGENAIEIKVELAHDTLVLQEALRLHFAKGARKSGMTDPQYRIHVGGSNNLLDTAVALMTWQADWANEKDAELIGYHIRNAVADGPAVVTRKHPAQRATAVFYSFKEVAAWRSDHDLYLENSPSGRLLAIASSQRPRHLIPLYKEGSLSEWHQYWGTSAAGITYLSDNSFDGKALRKKAASDPFSLSAKDYRRVFAGRTAKRVLLESAIAGANTATVGPGDAYQAWRNTLDYQAWAEAPSRSGIAH